MKVCFFVLILIVAVLSQNIVVERKDVPCTVCQTVVVALHALIRQNASQEVLFKQADRLCPLVNPPEYRPKVCPRMIRLMGPIIVQVGLSRREIQAKYFCQLLGVCAVDATKMKLIN
jgi:hypothetical protein